MTTANELAEQSWCFGAPYFGARDKDRSINHIELLLTAFANELLSGVVMSNTSQRNSQKNSRLSAEEVAAQLWCTPEKANTTLDVEFCKAIAKALNDFANERVEEDRKRAIEASGFVEKVRSEALDEAANLLIFKPGEDRLTFDPACIKELREQPAVAMRKLLAGFAEEIRALKSSLRGEK